MDSLKKMNEAINHIEENFENDIDLKEVAKIALCSQYHFQRMFPISCRCYAVGVYSTMAVNFEIGHAV